MSKERKLTLAGGLFMLAGAIGLLTSFFSEERGSVAIGAAFIAIGAAFLAMARKQDGRG